jgi:hypothetical protein
MSRITEIFEAATETSFPREGKTASLSPDNIRNLFKAIAEEISEFDFRREVGCTSDMDLEIAQLIKTHFAE